jgi:hypothetical protein
MIIKNMHNLEASGRSSHSRRQLEVSVAEKATQFVIIFRLDGNVD